MVSIFPDVVMPFAATMAGAVVTVFGPYLLWRKHRKTARTPILRFEPSDVAGHENLGAVGFRHIQSKTELLISGTIKNVGPVLATDVMLDIYHFQSSNAPPVHEIVRICVTDALQPGETLAWRKSIRLADLTVDGRCYKSGPTGVFRDDWNDRYYHHHVVFSCRNVHDEEASAIYGTEKVIENNAFVDNRMMFIRQAGRYRPRLPSEWRVEIKAKERALKQLMAAPSGGFSQPTTTF